MLKFGDEVINKSSNQQEKAIFFGVPVFSDGTHVIIGDENSEGMSINRSWLEKTGHRNLPLADSLYENFVTKYPNSLRRKE